MQSPENLTFCIWLSVVKKVVKIDLSSYPSELDFGLSQQVVYSEGFKDCVCMCQVYNVLRWSNRINGIICGQ